MELNLTAKTVVVTGGSSNIGRAIALAFAAEGSNVVIADIDDKKGTQVAKQISEQSGKVLFVKTDVTDHILVNRMINKAIDTFGQIHILVNCVGWTIDRMFIEKERSEWEKEVNINLWGCINCTRAVVEHMINNKYGKIINISSDAGRIGEFREAVYSACKGGIIALSKSLAKEVGRYGITVNVVCPGVIIPDDSEMGEMSMWKGEMADIFTPAVREKVIKAYPLRRLGEAQEIANAVIFLASQAADYITGQTLSVSGGYTMI